MDAPAYDFEVVWMTSGDHGVPHAEAIDLSNPNLSKWVHDSGDHSLGSDGWRNCDRSIREFWKGAREHVHAKRVLFLEWDALVTIDLRTIFPAGALRYPGIEGVGVKSLVRDGRSWGPMKEANRLPAEMRLAACGIAPLAVLMISSEALGAIIDPKFDPLFEADIFCELRLPSLLKWLGFAISDNPALSNVKPGPILYPTEPGIFHAVKGGPQ